MDREQPYSSILFPGGNNNGNNGGNFFNNFQNKFSNSMNNMMAGLFSKGKLIRTRERHLLRLSNPCFLI